MAIRRTALGTAQVKSSGYPIVNLTGGVTAVQVLIVCYAGDEAKNGANVILEHSALFPRLRMPT